MFFLIKSAICIGVVYLCLPAPDAARVKFEVTRAVAGDRVVGATVDRAQRAAKHAANEAQRLCLTKGSECVDTASRVLLGR